MKSLSFLQKIIYFLNVLACIALLAAYMASYVNPVTFWPLAFFGLAYPLILAVNMCFLIFWLLSRKRQFILSLVFILVGLKFLGSIFAVNFPSSTDKGPEKGIKVMTYNVKSFDLYNWTDNIESKSKIIEMINSEAPVIMCIQEFYTEDAGELNNLEQIRNSLPDAELHFERTVSINGKEHWGLATFSNYPITGRGIQNFPDSWLNSCIFTDIRINGEIFRVYNVHLQSIHFGKEDYQYLKDISLDNKDDLLSFRKILGRLKRAFIKRSQQAILVAEHIQTSPYPVIVCGDFNDSPVSFAYHTISRGLKDAFIEAGWGIGQTYAGPFPFYRIDHILYSKGIQSNKYKTIRSNYSDHYPVWASLVF